MKRWGIPTLALAQMLSCADASPRYLSYFNFLGGGSRSGWHYFVDSSVDWGQDLLRLKSWMKDHGVGRIHLAYFGTGEPRAYGIPFIKTYRYMDFDPEEVSGYPAPGDYFACSVTLYQNVYVYDEQFKAWLQRLRSQLQPVGQAGDSILIFKIPN